MIFLIGGSPINQIRDAFLSEMGPGLQYCNSEPMPQRAHTYAYDAENRLVSVDNGATATYKYDHQNRRVSKAVGSSLTHYVWQGSQVIAEHDATTPLPPWWEPPYQVQSARVDYVYAGSRMVYSTQRTSSTGGWTVRYYLSDRLSTRVVLDSSGNVIGRQAHLPFGEDFAESGTQEKHHFTSYERDSETSTDYSVNRHYSLGLGRFNRPDPVSPRTDNPLIIGSIGDPQSLNRFSYTRNDPVNLKDSLGLQIGKVFMLRPGCWAVETIEVIEEPYSYWDTYGSGCEDIGDTGGSSGGGADGRGQVLTNLKPKNSAKKFLEKYPDCRKAINKAAKKAGGLQTIDDTLKGITFLDVADVPASTLAQSLRDLMFPETGSEEEMRSTLDSHVGVFATDVALTNPTTHTVYLSSLWDAHSLNPIDSTIVHEALHDLFQGDHKKVAEKLGLSTAGGDTATSRRITNWLDRGCK